MATSGSVDFTQTRDEIIKAALRKCGVLARNITPSARQINDAAEDLNRLIKAWNAQGIHIWTYQEMTLFLQAGKQSYLIGPSGDHVTASYVKTELSTAGAATDGTIEVDSITGISNGDNIGIVLDDNTIQWTTINGAPSGTTITLTAALTGAAAVDNHVYTYTTIANRPNQITSARIKINDGNETPMKGISQDAYFDLPTKTTKGKATQFFYKPTLTNGTLYLWPTADKVADTINLTTTRYIEDFDSTTNNPDFPQEWFRAIVFNLAIDNSFEYGVDDATFARLERRASLYLEQALDFDIEKTSVFFTPSDEDIEGWE